MCTNAYRHRAIRPCCQAPRRRRKIGVRSGAGATGEPQESPMSSAFATHEVLNQSPPFEDVNLFSTDRALTEAVSREGGGAAAKRLEAFGAACGSAAAFERGRLANENPPKLRSFDTKGRRLDVVEFHPAYHECMGLSMAEGLHCGAREHLREPGAKPAPGANVVRSAGCYMATQMEAGHQCPITMTNAAV